MHSTIVVSKKSSTKPFVRKILCFSLLIHFFTTILLFWNVGHISSISAFSTHPITIKSILSSSNSLSDDSNYSFSQQCIHNTKKGSGNRRNNLFCLSLSRDSQITEEKITTYNNKIGSKEESVTSLTNYQDKIYDVEAELQSLDVNEQSNEEVTSFLPILALCWFVALLSALDRVAMSVAILPLSSEYHLSDTIKGQISSVFSIGYGLGIVPCGLVLSAVSPRIIMAIGVTLWSLATFGTPLAALLIHVSPILSSSTVSVSSSISSENVESLLSSSSTIATSPTMVSPYLVENLVPLLIVRAVMGAAESVVLPTIQKILANWVPSSKKSLAVATVFSGFQVGTICAYLISPYLVDNFGWRGLFYIYGAVGVLWLIPWLLFANDYPTSSKPVVLAKEEGLTSSLNKTSKDLETFEMNAHKIERNEADIFNENALDDAFNTFKGAPWMSFVKSPAVWGITIAHAANNWGLYNSLSWTPIFYAEQYDLNVKGSALYSILPSVAGAICGLLAGYFADRLISQIEVGSNNQENELKRTNIRKVFQSVALLGPAVCLLVLSNHIPEQPFAAQLLLTGTIGLQAFNAAGYGSSAQEKAGDKWAGLLYSITSLPGVMFGSFGVYVTGKMLDLNGNDWSSVFSLNAAIDVIGALGFIFLFNSRREFD